MRPLPHPRRFLAVDFQFTKMAAAADQFTQLSQYSVVVADTGGKLLFPLKKRLNFRQKKWSEILNFIFVIVCFGRY